MELVVPEEEGKGYYLQHQEEEEVKMPSDEEKNVTHLCLELLVFIVDYWLPGTDEERRSAPSPYLMTNGYRS